MLAILACPICKGSLHNVVDEKKRALYCDACSLYYPVYKGIPILLKKEALTESQWKHVPDTI